MLSHEDNELLSRVGKGTPMGAVMRSIWLPLCRKQFLEAGGTPRRMRLLGEDLAGWACATRNAHTGCVPWRWHAIMAMR
jgi:phthalate 4,5-dioxygenase